MDTATFSARASEEWFAVHDAHVSRVAAFEALLRPMVPPTPYEVRADEARAPAWWVGDGVAGVASEVVAESLWVARRDHRLEVAAVSERALARHAPRLLDDWLDRLPAQVDDLESVASVRLASRDVGWIAPLVHRHFGPASVLALHDLGRDEPEVGSTESGVDRRIRAAHATDLDWLIRAAGRLQETETAFGYVPQRPGDRSLGVELAEAVQRDSGWTWLAEDEGGPIGFLQVNPPDAAAWVAVHTWLRPIGYVVNAFVDPAHRATGIGHALVAAAHARARAEGWSGLLLHHAASSPWSGPFWAAHGYRPLLTTWMRRPAR